MPRLEIHRGTHPHGTLKMNAWRMILSFAELHFCATSFDRQLLQPFLGDAESNHVTESNYVTKPMLMDLGTLVFENDTLK